MKKEDVKETILNPATKDEEIKKLKMQVAGYKGQVRTLQKRIADLEDSVSKKNETIDTLNIQVFNLKRFDKENEAKIFEQMEYIASLEDTIDRWSERPWWKKLFG